MATAHTQGTDLISCAQAAKLIPNRPHAITVYRWIRKGKLWGQTIGGRTYTTADAVEEFLNGPKPDQVILRPPASTKAKRYEAALESLRAQGIQI